MKRSTGFYVTVRATGDRIFLERSWKWDRWYFTADGWTTQATTKTQAIINAGYFVATNRE